MAFTACAATIDFGDNSSQWANDGECDDPRFEGVGMATATNDDDLRSDATDCSEAFQNGSVALIRDLPLDSNAEISIAGINFGDDSSQWANDGECDDPRFEGGGMATKTNNDDLRSDASDCSEAFQNGSITVK